MNKKQIGLILVAGLFCAGANAQVMLAGENKINTEAGTPVSGDIFEATGEIGAFIARQDRYFVRFELSSSKATFATVPTLTIALDSVTPNIAGTVTANRVEGGIGKSFVVMSIDTTDADITSDVEWTLDALSLSLKSEDDVDITYKLYSTSAGATGPKPGTPAFSSDDELIRFVNATSMKGEATTATANIDVGASSEKFENDTITTPIMEINILNTDGDQVAIGVDGAAINVDVGDDDLTLETIVDEIKLVVEGNFEAVKEDTVTKEEGKVWLDENKECSTPVGNAAVGKLAYDKDDVNKSTATIVIANEGNSDAETDGTYLGDIEEAYLCITTNGTSIPESSYEGTLTMTVIDPYEAIDEDTFDGSMLQKNTVAVYENFLLTPEGVFTNMVRVTNTSNIEASNIMVTVFNDEGDNVEFPLSAIEFEMNDGTMGNVSPNLKGGASTPLIDINDLYAAATDEDESFSAIDSNDDGKVDGKLRVKVEANVRADSLDIQALTLSRDNEFFLVY
ncbi:MAG: hypothetical protein OXC84_10130 [Gammaproteobacteria bacterium]|nr:hypothetical protein [Gammaproteobacteria bacterium]